MRIIHHHVLSAFALLCAAPSALAAPRSAPVAAREDATHIVLDNGLIGFSISKTAGTISSLRARINGKEKELGNGTRAMVFDYDNNKRQHVNFGSTGATIRLVSATPDAAEVSVETPPGEACPFLTDIRWTLRRGDSGFYASILFRHTKGMPAMTWEQTRAVIRTARGTQVFTNYVVDDVRQERFRTSPVLKTVFDTTWVYEGDGEAHSKYETSSFIGDDVVHGLSGPGVGLWVIAPSREYVNGGPQRQELTVHQDAPTRPPQNNIALWMLQGNHFGGGNMEIAADEEWSRFYGPAFIYVNRGGSTRALWNDAKRRAREEEAKWPYNWVQNPEYPLARGTVRGQIQLTNGQSARDAWVVLGTPGDTDWPRSARGYTFWTRADERGRFSIPKVRPGNYSLFVTGANQFIDFRRDGVRVSAGQNELGTLHWAPQTNGKTLWQIGTPDRSTREFAWGKDVRHYTNYLRYGKNFSNDVTYTIGKSREDRDWNFAQWGWHRKQPFWAVRFNGDKTQPSRGTATLTLAFASFFYPRGLQVTLNGQSLGVVNLPKSGMAAYRAGGEDSLRQTVALAFDAALIQNGANELRLAPVGSIPFDEKSEITPSDLGAVMYDALRLEVDANRAFVPAVSLPSALNPLPAIAPDASN